MTLPVLFLATVTYRGSDGREHQESFPVRAVGRESASKMAVAYVLEVLRLKDFELRIVGG
jgi:hypothetical protein